MDPCQGWGWLWGDVKVTLYLGYCGGRKGVCSCLLDPGTDVWHRRCPCPPSGRWEAAGGWGHKHLATAGYKGAI